MVASGVDTGTSCGGASWRRAEATVSAQNWSKSSGSVCALTYWRSSASGRSRNISPPDGGSGGGVGNGRAAGAVGRTTARAARLAARARATGTSSDLAGGAPLDQRGREPQVRAASLLDRAVHQAHEQVDRLRPHLLHGLAHRGQRRRGQGGLRDVVEADDREVVGDPQ